MKRIILLICLACAVLILKAQDVEFEKAADAVKNMKVGWNLGNTLDSHSGSTENMWIEYYTDRTPSKYETAWGQPVATLKLIKMFKEAGFNAIRVPVTWYPHMGGIRTDGLIWDKKRYPFGSKVDEAWMERVHEVVDYVISQGMYCILNVHHDTGDTDVAWVVADRDSYNANKDRFYDLWTQIANEFKDYDEYLLFEGYNEMLDTLGSWVYASAKADGGYNASLSSSAYAAVNGYAQTFVDAVRATGGNNISRNLIVTNYAASNCRGTGHSTDPFTKMVIPTDTLSGHIILQIHSYILGMTDLTASKNEASGLISDLNTRFVTRKVPVVIGEWGTLNEDDYTDNTRYENFKKYCKYFVSTAKRKNIATLFWMKLSDGQDRSVPKWTLEDLKDEIIKGYYGNDGYVGVVPVNAGVTYDSEYWLNGNIVIRNGRKYLVR